MQSGAAKEGEAFDLQLELFGLQLSFFCLQSIQVLTTMLFTTITDRLKLFQN